MWASIAGFIVVVVVVVERLVLYFVYPSEMWKKHSQQQINMLTAESLSFCFLSATLSCLEILVTMLSTPVMPLKIT